jgi:hypothetical protein
MKLCLLLHMYLCACPEDLVHLRGRSYANKLYVVKIRSAHIFSQILAAN